MSVQIGTVARYSEICFTRERERKKIRKKRNKDKKKKVSVWR